jgi:hypothetical protein
MEILGDGSSPALHHLQPTKQTSRARSASGDGTKNILSNINPDYWPSCRVKILSGKYCGQTAIVKCSGNGWVQLETPLGEVAKRATELELLEVGKFSASLNKHPSGLTITIPSPLSSSCHVRRRSNSESLVISPTSRNTIANARHSHSSSGGVTAGHKTMSTLTTRPTREQDSSHTVLIDSKIRNLQTDYFRKYVERQVAKVKHRPDLKYWNRQIHSLMVDEEHERHLARDLRENYCEVCSLEKWPESHVCWNELCAASPVYWKLPGAAGSPEVPLARHKQMESAYLQGAGVSASSGHSKRPLHSLGGDDERGPIEKRVKARATQVVMSRQAIEDERIACEVLRSLSSLSPGECFPNLVTEYLNISPELQVTPSQSPPSTVSASSSPSPAMTSPIKLSPKNERSDSGVTDSEDLIRTDRKQPLILRYRSGSMNKDKEGSSQSQHPPLVPVPETRPLQISTSSPHSAAAAPSPNSQPPKSKKAMGSFSPTRPGLFRGVQGTPPSQEEFARLVNEHHFSSASTQNKSPNPTQENRTPPLSALTARVDAPRGGSEAKPQDLFPGQDFANGPPLLHSTHSTMDSVFPPK